MKPAPLNLRSATLLGALLAAVSLSGCNTAEIARVVASESSMPTPARVAPTSPAPTPSATDAEDDTPSVDEVAYTPPFPERSDLFSPPKQAPRAKRTAQNGSSDDVVLMGFADLEGPRVVLAINGVVKPLGGGEEAGGVRVISIAPPRAVLQRGRSRWTASIE